MRAYIDAPGFKKFQGKNIFFELVSKFPPHISENAQNGSVALQRSRRSTLNSPAGPDDHDIFTILLSHVHSCG